jgi:hypothetical protein
MTEAETQAAAIIAAIEVATDKIISEIRAQQARKEIALPDAQRHHEFAARHRLDAA